MKTVSVILTTYNSAEYIQKTVDSILNQKGIGDDFNLELIAVDDSSSDNTPEILKQNKLILLSTETNSGGPNRGRNLGIKKSTGDYICIADHDDEWHENKISVLLPYLELCPIVTSGYTVINKVTGKKIMKVSDSSESHVLYKSNQTFIGKLTKSLKSQNTYLGSIIYNATLRDVLFEEHFGVVDYDWVLRLFHENSSIEVCSSLYNRYVDNKNLSLDESYRAKDFYYSLLFIERYEELYPREVSISNKRIHGSRARYFYMTNEMKKARKYFLKSQLSWKTIAYYITSYFGSTYVKDNFEVFG